MFRLFKKYLALLLFVATNFMSSFGATIDLTRTEFYVKENGSGSGTSWTDAMSGTDFAAVLPKVKDGTTFYVAAGTYKPIYTIDGSVAKSNTDKSFGINSSVTIKGGYSKNASSPDAIYNPKRHVTLFTADIDNDDIVEINDNSISRTNFENNSNNLIHLNAKNKTLTLSGVTVSNANSVGLLSLLNGNKLILSDCIFKDNTCGIRSIDDSSIDITNSTFQQNEYPIDCGNAGSDENDCKVDIKQTVFSSNQSDLRFHCGSLIFDEIEYSYNKGQIWLDCNGDLSVKNSTFEHNECNDLVLLLNTKENKYDMLIENSSFKQNDVSRLLFHSAVNQNLKIRNCIISNNTVYDVLGTQGTQGNSGRSKIFIESSSFTNNTADYILESSFITTLTNNTIAENDIKKSVIFASSTLTMENNTILDRTGNGILQSIAMVEARGNIILPSNSSKRAIVLAQDYFELENNIITNGTYQSGIVIDDADYEGNIHLTDENSINEALAALFEGKITSSGFEPKISFNKDNFPTLNLISDVLSNGITSIRYPLVTTSQTTDQFGATRYSLTCMGSLELCADDIDVEWEPKTYNICDNSSLGEYEIHYTFKDNSPSSLFYGVVKNEKGETFKSSTGSNRVKSGYIVFRDLPVGEYSNMRFFVESGTCKEINFHDGEAQIPNSFKILSTESMATLDLRTTSDSKCAAEGSGLFSVYCSKSVTTFQVFDDEGEKVDEFVVDSCPLSTSLIIKDEVKSVQNLKAGKYHVRYAGCPENISDFEIEVGAPFSATAKLLETCMSSPGRVVLEVYDANGNPASGDFSFHNPEYPENALEELDGNPNNSDPKDNVRMFSEGKYLIQNAGRPADVILVSDGTCEIEVPTEKYTAKDDDLKINIEEPKTKFCAGDETGSIEFSYNGFKGGDYYDVALRLDDGPFDFLYGQKNSLVYENLAPGEHRITARITTGYMGCNISDGDIYDKVITLEVPETIKVTPKVSASSCGKSNGSVEIVITGWNASENSWKFYKKEDAATSSNISFSKTVTSNTDGTVSVKQTSLAGGVYVFEWKEACGKINTESVTIPSGTNKPISVTDIIEGYSCKEKADGKITYVVTNWTSDCSATLDKIEKKYTTLSNDGVAEFVFSGLANDYYEFSVIDGCGDSYPLTSDLKGAGTALTMRRFTVKPNSNRCVINDRVIQIAVSGGKTSSYLLDLRDASGKSVLKKTINGSYTTAPLSNGTYNAVISNSDESCTVTSSSVTLSSKFTVALTSYDYTSCPNSTSDLRLVAEVKRVGTNTVGSDLSFIAVDGEGAETEIPSTNIRPLGNGKYVLVHVPATTDYIVTSDGDCAYISYMKDAAIGTVSTAGMTAEISSKNQTCHETNNAEISADFSKMNALYDINFTLAPEKGESSTKTSYAESGTLSYDKLSAGAYSADVWVAIENCNLTSLAQETVTIESPESDLKISIVSTVPSKCGDDGAVSLRVTDLYKNATYQYAFYKKGTASPDYSKLTPASNNTFLYENDMLAAGTYVFAVKDGCDKTFTKEVVIAGEEVKSLTITVGDVVGYSCVEAKDGSVSFSVDNWTEDCTAKLDGVAKTPISVEKEVAQFKFDNLGKKSCVFAVANGCDKAVEKTVTLNESELKIDEFKILGSDKNCDDDQHKLVVSVSGGNTEKYNYQFFDSEGKIVDEVVGEKNKYQTPRLLGGSYTVKVSVNDNCSVTSEGLDIIPTYTTTLSKLDMPDCNAETQRIVVEIVKESAYEMGDGMEFYYVSPESKKIEITDNSRKLDDNRYLLTGVPANSLAIATSDNKCTSVANLSDAEKLSVSLPDVKSEIETVNQTCYKTANGGVSLNYSGMDNLYDLTFNLEKNDKIVRTGQASDKSGTLSFDKVSAGTYTAKVALTAEGCVLSDLKNENVTITSPADKLVISLNDIQQNNCSPEKDAEGKTLYNGSVSFGVEGWYSGYKWTIFKGTEEDEPEDLEYSSIVDKDENGGVSISKTNLGAGEYVLRVVDGCETIDNYEFNIENNLYEDYTFEAEAPVPYTCVEASNGIQVFNIGNWQEGDEAVLKWKTEDGEVKEKTYSPTKKENSSLVSFSLEDLRDYDYDFVISGVCNRILEQKVSLKSASESNGSLDISIDFDKNAAKCDVEKRKVVAKALGVNNGDYVFEILDKDGKQYAEKNQTESTFTSDILPVGTYSVKVTTKEVCSKVSDKFTIESSLNPVVTKLDGVCEENALTGDRLLATIPDLDEDSKVSFVAVDINNKSVDVLSKKLEEEQRFLLLNVPLSWKSIVVSSGNCVEQVNKEDVKPEKLDVSTDVTVEELNVRNCFGESSVELKYKGFNGYYDLVCTLESENSKITIPSQISQDKSGSFEFSELPVGKYKIYLNVGMEGCTITTTPVYEKSFEIKEIAKPFKIVSVTPKKNNCEEKNFNGSVEIVVEGVYASKYKWSISTDPLVPEWNDGENKDVNENGDVTIKKEGLKDDSYIFTMTDVCGEVKQEEFEVGKDYIPQAKVNKIVDVPYSCPEAKNAAVKFIIGNWDQRCTVTFDGEPYPKFVETATEATFEYSGYGSGVHTFKISDACNRSIEETVDFDKISKDKDFRIEASGFDASKAACNIESRKLIATLAGGNAEKYTYKLTSDDGTVIDELNNVDDKTYTSSYLPDGHIFTLEVKSDEGCVAKYTTNAAIVSPENIKAYRKAIDCGVIQTLFVVESENVIEDAKVYAISRSDKSHLLGSMKKSQSYSRTLSSKELSLGTSDNDVIFDYVKVVRESDGCEILIPLEDYEEENKNPFDGVLIPISNTQQKCIDVNDGSILVDLKNVNTKYNTLMTVVNVETKEKYIGEQYENTTIYMVKDLAPGEYKVSLDLTIGDCPLGVSHEFENQTIKKMGKLEVENLPLHHTRCVNGFADTAIVKLTGWVDGVYNWTYRLKNSKLSDGDVEYYEAEIAPDNHIVIFAWHPGKAYLQFYDHCKNKVAETTFDIPEPDVDFRIDNDVFDPSKAKCDVDYHSLKLDFSGNFNEIVSYTLTSGDEVIDNGMDIANNKYVSPILPYGKLFHFEAKSSEGCKVSYDTKDVLTPYLDYKGSKKEVKCGDEKSTMIIAKYDNSEGDGIVFAMEPDGSWTELDKPMLNGFFKTIVKRKDDYSYKYIKIQHDECDVLVELEEYKEDGDPLANNEPEIVPIPQTCYGVNNGHITAKYESVNSEYDVIFSATSVDDENYVVYGEDRMANFCVIDSLPVGKYKVKMHLAVGGCPVDGLEKEIGEFSVENLVENPLVIKEHVLNQSYCFEDKNFKPNVTFYFENFYPGIYTWKYKVGETEIDELDLVLNNSIYFNIPNEGHLVFTVKDRCAVSHPKEHIWTVEDDVVRQPKPTISAIEDRAEGVCPGDGSSLLVEFDNAVDGKGMIYVEFNTVDNANFMEKMPELPKLPKSGKFRIYDFQYGSYGEAFSYTYDLDEDVERKLVPGLYNVGYKNTDELCPGEIVWVTDTVRYPIKLKMAVRDVLCESTNEAAVCFVPERPYESHVNYTIHSDVDSDRGSNWVALLGKSASEQRAAFEKKFVLGHVMDAQHPFRSNVFEDIKEIRIAPTPEYKHNQEALDAAINDKEGRMKYPLQGFRLGNDVDRVVSDYFGIRQLPAGEYVITTTDMEGCTYEEKFEVKGPKYPLAIYDPEYDSDGYCDSDKRRISFKAIGGWTKDNNESSYDFYLVDSKKKLDDLFDTEDVNGSLILDNDYVGLSRKEALPPVTDKIKTTVAGVVKEVEYENAHSEKFISPILDPGTYNLVVIDDLGCVATLEAKIEVKAKYTLDGKAVMDKCDPLTDNRLYPEVSDGVKDVTSKVSSYTLRIGHATECVGYPFGCFALGHVHECYADDDHPERKEYPNCVAMESSDDKHPLVSRKEKDGTSGVAITKIPRGKIGVFAVMEDGCTAFNEFEYYTKGIQKLTLTNLETFAAKCNGVEDENGGALHFELYGGNKGYRSLKLDNNEIPSKDLFVFKSHKESVAEKEVTKDELVDNQNNTTLNLYENGLSIEDVIKKYGTKNQVNSLFIDNWYDKINYRFTPLEELSGVVDEDGNVNYDYLDIFYKDYKYSYSFVLPNLSGTTEYTYDENGKVKKTPGNQHKLVVVDNEGCTDTLKFFIDQPAKLEVFPKASMPCPDGVGRIITSNTRGGTAPYRWSVEKFDSEELNKIYNENKSEDQLPKNLSGKLLSDKYRFLEYYQDNTDIDIEERGVAVERIPADVYKKHTVFAYDANGCVAKGIQETYNGPEGDWDNVKTDYLVARYHNYGDVLLLTDNSYYDKDGLKFENNYSDETKGFDTPFIYDSMHVEVKFNTEGMVNPNKEIVENLIVERKPSSLYVYGVKEGNTVEFDGKKYEGPLWGVPSEVASSVLPDDEYDEYYEEFMKADKVLDDYAEVVAKTSVYGMFKLFIEDNTTGPTLASCINGLAQEDNQKIIMNLFDTNMGNFLYGENGVRQKLMPIDYLGEVVNKETGERKAYSIDRISEKVNELRSQILTVEFWNNYSFYSQEIAYNESLLRYFNSEREYESYKGKIDGHCKLSDITKAFDLLIDPNEAETEVLNRMAFIKFTKSDKEDKKEKDISVDDLFNSLKEHQIPFGIKVTTYITGCDLTTELNGLYVLNQDTLPYDSPEYKTTIELSATPNPAVDGTTTVLVTTNKAITNDNPLTYFVYSVDGKNTNLGNNVKFYGENGTSNKVIMDNGDGWITEYNYSISLSGLDDMNGYVFVAKFGDRTESIKILTK